MIFTSSFSYYTGSDAVGIARFPPKWWDIDNYPEYAPRTEDVIKYKAGDISVHELLRLYKDKILINLDPQKAFEFLNGKVLLCFEKAGDPCHRRIFAQWLETSMGVVVPEFQYPEVTGNEMLF